MPLTRGSIYKRGRVWWAKWPNPHLPTKPHRKSTGCTDKRAAVIAANRLIQRQELLDAGLVLPGDGEDLDELLERWRQHLTEPPLSRTPKHARLSVSAVRRYLDATNVASLAAINRDHAERYLAAEAKRRSWSARTYNSQRGYLKAFGRWLLEQERLVPFNPFDGVRTMRSNPVLERRALQPGEHEKLLAAAPYLRRCMYQVALLAGLRRGEIQRLEWRDVRFAVGQLVVRNESAKARRQETLPLAPKLRESLEGLRRVRVLGLLDDPEDVDRILELREEGLSIDAISKAMQGEGRRRGVRGGVWHWPHVKAVARARPRKLPQGELVFAGESGAFSNARGIYRDLEAAGIPVETEDGKLDWHALRRTFGTDLRRAGVHPHTIQRLMRHSDPRLTSLTYADFSADELLDAARLL